MKKLMKSKDNSVIMGVCGGIGEYFNIDPLVIRVLWAVSLIPFFTTSIIIYLICGFIMPYDDGVIRQDDNEESTSYNINNNLLIGGLLILVGAFFLAREFLPNFMNIVRLWPALLIVAGIYVIFKKMD